MSLRMKVLFGFIIICLIWGSSWAAVKIGLESVPPLFALGFRLTLASIILGIHVFFKKLTIPRDKNFWVLVLVMIFSAFTVPFVLIYWGQIRVDSGLSSVLFATLPFWVAIFSYFLLPHEKITSTRLVGIVLGFLGVVIIFQDGISGLHISMFYGMLAIIIGAIIQALGLVFLRRLGKDAHPVMLNFCSMLLSAVPIFLASFLFEDYSHLVLNNQTIGAILYLSFFCTVITFVIYFWLVKYVEAVLLSLSAFITPVIAVAIGVILMGESITKTVLIGSGLVLIGVAWATFTDVIALYRRGAIKGPL